MCVCVCVCVVCVCVCVCACTCVHACVCVCVQCICMYDSCCVSWKECDSAVLFSIIIVLLCSCQADSDKHTDQMNSTVIPVCRQVQKYHEAGEALKCTKKNRHSNPLCLVTAVCME